jgi:CRISPR-associated helicase Cas3/CRISPR-associated endonuclease Cas3-HD
LELEYNLISHSLNYPLGLHDHIDQVVKATKYLVAQKSLNFSGISKKQIEELSILVAVCHDFGKSTSFFQEYIQTKVDGTKYTGNERDKSHALVSALFGWYMAEKWVSKNTQLNEHWKSFLPFAVFLAIEGHHGRYKSIKESLKSIDKNFGLIKKQIDNVNPEIFEYDFFGVKLMDGKDFDIGVVYSISSKLEKLRREYAKIDLNLQIEHRIFALFLYSILLESDKAYLASDYPKQYKREPIDIPDNLVDKYLEKFEKTKPINKERNKAYRETIGGINTFPLNERIHSITLPTGLGKTLLSASWALKLRTRLEKESGFTPKIIVSLPFLSIIEQTDEEYRKFLGELYEQHKDQLYMPRYSIADFEYKDGIDDEERSDNSVDFFLNIWNSEIVVSTFDQLLYSLFSLKSKHLMRFHNLLNAIIIFDEIQALPSELWKPFECFFKKLSEVGNTHVLLMSATQPGFFPGAIERVSNHKDYFKNRKRVTLDIKPERKSLEIFVEELSDSLNEHSNESVMIVLNTRNSSKFVYKKIKEMIDGKIILERPIIYLSSLVTPSQRRGRISEIKDSIRNGGNPVVVTTQCIEAGVDIDMDYIVRDWAPLDSIFQVCGRCNRNGEKDKGVVKIVSLESDKGKLFSEMVYDDNIRLECTARSVEGSLEITENQFYSLGSRYFEFIRPLLGQSMKIVMAYSEYSHKYDGRPVNIKKLLRGDEYQEQFIIPSLDEKLPTEIRQALDIEDRWERRYAIKKLAKRISANSVSIRFEKWMAVRPDDLIAGKPIGNFRILDEQFYDKEGVGLDVDLTSSIGGTVEL